MQALLGRSRGPYCWPNCWPNCWPTTGSAATAPFLPKEDPPHLAAGHLDPFFAGPGGERIERPFDLSLRISDVQFAGRFIGRFIGGFT